MTLQTIENPDFAVQVTKLIFILIMWILLFVIMFVMILKRKHIVLLGPHLLVEQRKTMEPKDETESRNLKSDTFGLVVALLSVLSSL